MNDSVIIFDDGFFKCEKCGNHVLKVILKKPLALLCLKCNHLWKEEGWVEKE